MHNSTAGNDNPFAHNVSKPVKPEEHMPTSSAKVTGSDIPTDIPLDEINHIDEASNLADWEFRFLPASVMEEDLLKLYTISSGSATWRSM